MTSTRNTTKKVLAGVGAVLAIMLAIMSGEWIDLGGYWYPVLAIAVGLVILSEAAVSQYFSRSKFKSLDLRDFLNLVSIIFGAGIVVLGILRIPFVSAEVPTNVLSFFGNFGVIAGLGAAAFALIHLFLKDR